MSLPIQRRDFDVFLSHAHKDSAFVSRLDGWLTSAGLRVWFDARELAGGAMLATDLQAAIERCRGIMLVASGESLARGWVKAEYNSAMDERANHDAFRVVALRLPDANVKELMKGTTWIDVPGPQLTADSALATIQSFYPGEKRPNPATARDVYVSCSWQDDDSQSARAVCHSLVEQGFRLIGDARDQKGFGSGRRVERIIASCGALVAIMKKICQAFLVLADITGDNLNTCIEAGMALAAGANVELVSRGPARRPPFMLRGLQMPTYEGDVDRVAVLHRILRPYRRRVINAEL